MSHDKWAECSNCEKIAWGQSENEENWIQIW